MPKNLVRVIALVLAGLMALGVFSSVIYILASNI